VNLPNRISAARIVLVPFFIAAVVYNNFKLALAIFILCVISDGLDGYLARVRGERTTLGSLLDPVADKFLLISAFIALSFSQGLPPALRFPPYVPLVVVSRDILIILGCIIIYVLKGKVDIRPTVFGKITTLLQMLSIAGILTGSPYSTIVWNMTVFMTVVSGLDYMRIAGRALNES